MAEESVDRITKLLTKPPSLFEVGIAAARAHGGRGSFGEALNALRAKEISNEITLQEILSGKRKEEVETRKAQREAEKFEREMGLKEAELGLKATEADRKERQFLGDTSRLAQEAGLKEREVAVKESKDRLDWEKFEEERNNVGAGAKMLGDFVKDTVPQEDRSSVWKAVLDRDEELNPQSYRRIVVQEHTKVLDSKRDTKLTERDKKIAGLVDRGLSKQDAEDLTDGRIRIVTTDMGYSTVVNLATGETRPLGGAAPRGDDLQGGARSQTDTPNIPKKVRDELIGHNTEINKFRSMIPDIKGAVEKGVGAIPLLEELWGKIGGQLPTGSFQVPLTDMELGTGDKAVNKEVVMSRNALRLFREQMLESFRAGRMPIQQQNRLMAIFDKTGAINSVGDANLMLDELDMFLATMKRANDAMLGIETVTPEKIINYDSTGNRVD